MQNVTKEGPCNYPNDAKRYENAEDILAVTIRITMYKCTA